MIPGPAASVSRENQSVMQIIKPHSRPTESEILG